MDNQITINIHGSCVSRDVFEYDDKHLFKVNEYIARNSLFSVISPPPKFLDLAFFTANNAWQQRMIFIDYNKLLFERLDENPSDFFLIDLIDERFSLNKIEGSFITWTSVSEACLNLEKNLVHAMYFYDNAIKDPIGLYCERLLSLYAPHKIILYKAYFKYKYISAEGESKCFPQDKVKYYSRLNEHFSRCYDELSERLNCIIIEMPKNAEASEIHKWGLAPMHYTEQANRYVFRELEKICNLSL